MQDIVFFISQHLILSSTWFFFLSIIIFLLIKNMFLKSNTINNAQAIRLINKKNAIVVDTRSLKIFQKGHIINSINFPLKNIFLGKFEEIEMYKNCPIILIFSEMYTCNKYIKEFLKRGFNNIYILKNGIYDWNLEKLPLITDDK